MIGSATLYLVVAAYFALVLGVSIWGYRRTRTEEDFLAAGRSIGPWVGGAVLAATQISAGTFVGTLGRHYLTGVSWIWIWFGLWTGWVISAVCVAPKLRRFGALTVADYVGQRFASERARILAAALIIVGYTIYLTAQFQAIGEIASAIFGLPPLVAMMALLASTGFYTALGGVRSSSYIEFIQTVIMVLALVCAVPVVVSHAGGLRPLGEYVGSIEPRATGWWFTWRELLAYGLAFGLSIAAAPYEMTRYYSMRDEATVRYAIGISMAIQAVIGASVMILGLGMRGLFPYLPSPDQASSIMASVVMSPLLGSLFLVAMMSAIMSTVNSILLVTGGAVAHDLYKPLVNPHASQGRLLLVNRLSIVALAVIPFWAALQRFGDVQTIVVEQAKFIASFFFVPIVLGLNWRRGTKEGAVCSMIAGFAGCLLWTYTWQRDFAVHGIDAVEVGVLSSALAFIVVSRLTPPTPPEHLRIFFPEEGAVDTGSKAR
ncbi:MAG TPA: sodium:solute symporter family protein [Vicinamibacterales bacterium]|nr:sodium:solute symporter family protein [Vicinamibacterales bacterium]